MTGPGRIVIVGNGIAGVTAAGTLRAEGYAGDLIVVGEEPHAAYSRPALSKALLRDELTAHELPAPDHGATELLGVGAVALDPERRVVTLSDGQDLAYDGLVIASGARPRTLGGGAREFCVRTLEDALVLRDALADGRPVVVIGGGPLGMEIASGCLGQGCEVTLVAEGAPLAGALGDHLAAVVGAAATAQGLKIVAAGADSITETGDGVRVHLRDGSVIEAGVAVSAVGDVPNTEWLATSGLLADGVLVVDSRGRVGGRSDVVAAGDVAVFPTAYGLRRVPLWTSAIDQAKVAAAALLHGDEAPELEFSPYFWTEGFGLTVKACGWLPVSGEPEVVDGDPAAGEALLRWSHADGTATAVALNYRIPVPRLRRLMRPATTG